ncbi:glycosyltransferase family 2 protein [Phenylobacterium sp. LjRoot225]|uniref:glycosyltransferase family 2 protein n=1 Tax=Phenylobacterium sp. LjRoot225 TaxID=3342285 RepID=UPI003ED155D4
MVRSAGAVVGKVELPHVARAIDARELSARIARDLYRDVEYARHRDLIARLNPVKPPPVTATVAICTRERPELLAACLEGLTAANLPCLEILAVDNRPTTERTAQVVARFPSVRYVREDRPGLNSARNCAFAHASGDVIAFVDDDAVVDPDWLHHLLAPFEDPEVFCVTGLTLPLELRTTSQEHFERFSGFTRRGFRRRAFRWPSHNPISTGMVGAGVNMAIRRSAATRLGGFDPALDAGTPTRSGGDHEYFARILRAGYKIVYEPRAINRHSHRQTWDDLADVFLAYGVGTYAYWTRLLVVEKEFGVFQLAWKWLSRDQGPRLVRTLLNRGRGVERRLLLAELWGCLLGPWRYLSTRRRLQRAGV